MKPIVSVIVVSYNTKDLLRRCLKELKECTKQIEYEVIVVDNASVDGSVEMLESEFPWVQVQRSPKNLGFAGANNLALQFARGRYILLLNSDAFLLNNTVAILCETLMARPEAAAAAPRLFNEDLTHQETVGRPITPTTLALDLFGASMAKILGSGRKRPYPIDEDRLAKIETWMTGACLMLNRAAIDDIGALDPTYFFLMEDVDWCWSARRAGWELWYAPSARVMHVRGGSGKKVRGTPFEIQLKKNTILQNRYFAYKHYPFSSYLGGQVLLVALLITNFCRRLVALPLPQPSGSSSRIHELKTAIAMLQAGVGPLPSRFREQQ